MFRSPFHNALRVLTRSSGGSSEPYKQLFLIETSPLSRRPTWQQFGPISSVPRGITRSVLRSYSKATASDVKILDNQILQDASVKSQEEEKQARTPWHREGAHLPPVEREAVESAKALTKGRSSSHTAWAISDLSQATYSLRHQGY